MPTRRSFLLGGAAAVSTMLAAPRARVSDIRTISLQPEFYHGWPTLIRSRAGALLLVYSGGRESHVCPFGRVDLMRSHDDGKTWSWPETLMDSAIDDRDAGICETGSGALLVTIIELVRRGRLTEDYSFIWIVCAVALLALSLWRNLLDLAASALGVHYPPAVLLLVLTFFVVIVSLYFSVVVSRHRKDIEKLVEELALLDAEVRALRESVGTVAAGEVVPRAANEGGRTPDERRFGRH